MPKTPPRTSTKPTAAKPAPAGARAPAPRSTATAPEVAAAPEVGTAAAGDSAPEAGSAPVEPTPVDPAVLAEIRAHWPMPTAMQVRAYRSQFGDAVCEQLGARTRAVLVLGEARGVIVTVHNTLLTPSGRMVPYAPTRFRYFIECVDDLDEAIEAERVAQGKVAEVKQLLTDAEVAATGQVAWLQDTLSDIAGEREAENHEIENALSTLKAPDDVVARSKVLVEVGRRWLGRKDEELHVLLDDFQLSSERLASVEKAAARLQRLRPEARGVRVQVYDTPAINRIEGRVLAEMRLVMTLFARARKKDRNVPSLVPGPGTRAVLGHRPKSKKEPEPTPASAPAPDVVK
jgi:hypothetical protein